MQDTQTAPRQAAKSMTAPEGFHHHSWVVSDHERTRAFYEDVLGIPLIAFWIENDVFQGEELFMGHAFYGLKDGSRLSFFNLSGEAAQAKFKSPKTEIFNHIALHVDDETQALYRKKLTEAGLFNFSLDHGYCHSLYTMDPDGLRLEFAVDSPKLPEINSEQLRDARGSMQSWIDGNRNSNNRWAPPKGNRQS